MKSTVFQIRVSPEDKIAWQKEADRAGISLAAWIKNRCYLAPTDEIARQLPLQEVEQFKANARKKRPKQLRVPEVEHRNSDVEEPISSVQGFSPKKVPLDGLCDRCRRIGSPACQACRKSTGITRQ